MRENTDDITFFECEQRKFLLVAQDECRKDVARGPETFFFQKKAEERLAANLALLGTILFQLLADLFVLFRFF